LKTVELVNFVMLSLWEISFSIVIIIIVIGYKLADTYESLLFGMTLAIGYNQRSRLFATFRFGIARGSDVGEYSDEDD